MYNFNISNIIVKKDIVVLRFWIFENRLYIVNPHLLKSYLSVNPVENNSIRIDINKISNIVVFLFILNIRKQL